MKITLHHLYTALLLLWSLQPVGTHAREAAAKAQQANLSFIANVGQVTDQHGSPRTDIDYRLDAGNGLTIFIGRQGLHYQWARTVTNEAADPLPIPGGLQHLREKPQPSNIEMYRMDMVLEGAGPKAKAEPAGKQQYYEQYYTLPGGATAHSYTRIVYRNIYPHIDWVLYVNGHGLKYDFVVRKGGNPANIRMRYKGATALALQGGALTAATPYGSITEAAPYTYISATGQPVASAFVLDGETLRFHIPTPKDEITIDPSLKWATYCGGNGQDWNAKMAVDTAGNIYQAGRTASTANLATTGAHQTVRLGTVDAYLAKFDANGAKQWITYVGGTGSEEADGVVTDLSGNVYITGNTTSTTGIATPGAHMPARINGTYGGDAFLIKFNTAGVLQWGTYFGGPKSSGGASSDRAFAIACDTQSNTIYIGGVATSTTGIATTGAFQTTPGGGFLAKFSATGSLLWATYINGDVYGIACHRSSAVYVCGVAGSTTGIGTTGTYRSSITLSAGADGFLMNFSPSGSRTWGTYYGGSADDYTLAVTADDSGNAYIGGYARYTTIFSDFATPGAHQPAMAGSYDGFIAKFNGAGQRIWGTFYGGATPAPGFNGSYEPVLSLCTGNNMLYVLGATNFTDGIATPNTHQPTHGGAVDNYVVGFTPNGQRIWGTYYGGANSEIGALWPPTGSISYRKNHLYISGCTGSTNGIATPGAAQPAPAGSWDGYIAVFELDTTMFTLQVKDTLLCIGDSLRVPFGVTTAFNTNNNFTLQLSNASGSFTSPTTLATLTGHNTAGTFRTTLPTGIPAGNGYRLRIVSTSPATVFTDTVIYIRTGLAVPKPEITALRNPICSGNAISLSASPLATGATYTWTGPANTQIGTGGAYSLPTAATTDAGRYIITGTSNVCSSRDTLFMVVNNGPATPAITGNSPVCMGGSLQLSATSATPGVTYSWAGPNGFTATGQSVTIAPVRSSHAGSYTVTASINGCSTTASTSVQVNVVATIGAYASPGDTICTNGTATFVAFPQNAGPAPAFQWFRNGLPVSTNKVYKLRPVMNGDKIWCSMTVTGVCAQDITLSSDTVKMTVYNYTLTPAVRISADPGLAVSPTQMVLFKANPIHGGDTTSYQWYKNGLAMTGAGYSTWTTDGLYFGDKISVRMQSNDPCVSVPLAYDTVTIGFPAGINDRGHKGVQLYPNPNKGSFTITGITPAHIHMQVLSVLGQVLHSQHFDKPTGTHTLHLNLPPGVYQLRLHSEREQEVLSFIVVE